MELKCLGCTRKVKVSDDSGGKTVRCPYQDCRQLMRIPERKLSPVLEASVNTDIDFLELESKPKQKSVIRKREWVTLACLVVCLGVFVLVLLVFNSTKPITKSIVTKQTPKNDETSLQNEAEKKLRLVLDSWVLQEPFKKFDQSHPDLIVWRPSKFILDDLLRYKIHQELSKENGYHYFSVTLTFRTDQTHKKSDHEVRFSVWYNQPKGEWWITGL